MKTILAAIDFSPVSRRVIAEAVRLGRAMDARVVVLHAVKPPAIVTELAPLAGEALQLTIEIERAARRNLRHLQTRLAKRRITIETTCEQGSPVGVILATATKLVTDLIVVGSHGHTALYDLVVGSTARGVLKRAKVPVVVTPSRPSKRTKRQHATM